jgi:predicted flap endonuclease-1-like 5' DNA nuclease
MFQKWGFLLSEIWGLLAIAALLGLFAGWLIWARRSTVTVDTSEADRLRADLAACSARGKEQAARIVKLEAEVSACETRARDAEARANPMTERAAPANGFSGAPVAIPTPPVPPAPPAPVAAPLLAAAPASKPSSLAAARDGKPDDLKLIKGVGPVLEELCHKLGFFHFDQIAAWTAAEIAWVDENLEGFKGRVTRDEWVTQARDLAAGKAPRPGGEH